MTISRPAMLGIAILLGLSFASAAREPADSKQKEMQLLLLFNRAEGSEYFFFLENATSRPVSLLVDDSTALETAAECWSKHTVSRGSTLFPLRDPDALGHTLPDTDIAPGMRLELKVSSPILSASANLLAKFKGGRCRIRIQLRQPNEIVESNEFEP